MAGQGEKMLIPDKRKKILEVFFKDPFKEVHLREVVRLSKVSLTNVDNSMRLFVKEDMFKRREVSNMVFFKPNLENETLLKTFEYLEMEKRGDFYSKNKKIARLLQKYSKDIVHLSDKKIQIVILFGSVARGDWTKESDVDMLAVNQRGRKIECLRILRKFCADVFILKKASRISGKFRWIWLGRVSISTRRTAICVR